MKQPSRTTNGFTIIELLIVIVVIGVLATITYLGYTNAVINSRSNAAKGTATAVQHKIEAYASVKGSFPTATNVSGYTSALNSLPDSALDPTSTVIGTPGPQNGASTVEVSYCLTPSVLPYGAYRIRYYDFSTKALSTSVVSGTLAPDACTDWKVLASS